MRAMAAAALWAAQCGMESLNITLPAGASGGRMLRSARSGTRRICRAARRANVSTGAREESDSR
jgi:hypothetical protein